MAHIVIVGALASSITNFRGDLIKRLIIEGHKVTAMSGPASEEQISLIKTMGANFISYPIFRNGLSPKKDFITYLSLRTIFQQINPDIVLAYTIKPVIWSGLALSRYRDIRFYAMIEGLGYAFQAKNSVRKLLMHLVIILYKRSLSKAKSVIFLNKDNLREFLNRRIIDLKRTSLIDGIGVNLNHFSQQALPETSFTFLMIARLLGEKGVREYLSAAKVVKSKYQDVNFKLLGDFDPSPDGMSVEEVLEWKKAGIVEFLDFTDDVRPFMKKCHVYVLPSYHEGMPRTTMEAMAIGRPILTTDVPGCRDTVEMGINGFLVPKGNSEELAQKMIWFVENPDDCQAMGDASRKIAKNRFDVDKINLDIMRIMELI